MTMPRSVGFAIRRLLREGFSVGEVAATLAISVSKVRRHMPPSDADAAPAVESWNEAEELPVASGRTRTIGAGGGAYLPRNASSAIGVQKKKRKPQREGNRAKTQSKALETSTMRRLWDLASCPHIAAMLGEANAAVETLFDDIEAIRFHMARAYVRRISGVLPIPIPAGREALQSVAIIDTAENTLALVIDRAPDGTARFCGPANRSRRVESLLAQMIAGPRASSYNEAASEDLL